MKFVQLLVQLFFIATCWDRIAAVTFNCNFFETTHLPLGYVYACFLTRLDEIDNPTVTKIVGNHKPRKTSKDIALLHASKVKFDSIPKDIEKYFPNLIGFFMHNTGIKTISQDDLKPFPKLHYLMMQNCEIEELQDDLFEHNNKMSYLNFNKNKLKSVGSRVLASVPNLKYANFEKNVCVDAKAENEAQLAFLKSKIGKCYKNGNFAPTTTVCPPAVLSCPPPNCALARDKEIERLKRDLSSLKIENANLRMKNRQAQEEIGNRPSSCQQFPAAKPNPNDVKSLKNEIADLKLKMVQREVTVKSFKDELAKKSAEFQFESDNSVDCKQKLESVTKALSEVNGRLKYREGNPGSAVKSYEKMSRGECIEELKYSSSDKETCGSENEYLMDKLSLLKSVSITCEVSAWDGESSCNAVNFKCHEENQKVLMVKNKNQKAVDKTKINELLVLNQHTLFLPVGIGEIFTNLIKMTLTNSYLTKLDSFAFNFANLKILSLSANKITDIFDSDLINLEKLEILDLSANLIKKIKTGALANLLELKVLNLNRNKMEEIDYDLFEKNTKLTSIFLQHNRLKSIGSETLTPLNSLDIIDFSDNVCVNAVYTEASIKELNQLFSNQCGKPTRLCCRFERLSEKDVSCRAIEFTLKYKNTKLSSVKSLEDCITEDTLIDPRVVPKEDINEAKDVTILEFIDESVYFLPSNLADYFKELTKLVVVNSKLKSLSRQDFIGLVFLNSIQLSSNDLVKLETELFSETTSLQHLDISSNRLSEFPPKFFEKMTGLLFLNASNNDLVKLEADLFPRRNSLEEIYFDRNDLDDVDPKIFRSLKNAKIIDFTDNPCIGLKFPDDIIRSELANKAVQC